AELIRRLLEYQKYKRVAEDLGARAIAGRDVFSRGSPTRHSDAVPALANFSVFRLIDALKDVAKRINDEMSLQVDAERMSIQERIGELVELLRERRRCRFDELFEGISTSYELVVTFLALLEMAKIRLASIYQTDHEEPIYLEYTLLDEGGKPLVPEDVARTLAGHEAPTMEEPQDRRQESAVVPAGSSGNYGWIEDEAKS
ncbi:MAG: segregation/condensation protein A, partial [Acidobacteriota bacterium]|nr:segregation/condensation protein A [Acidobacteriota bacterium]